MDPVRVRFDALMDVVGSMVEWLERRNYDPHGLGSKSTRAILLYPWERHFTALYPAWWSWKTVLKFSHISIKLKKQNKKFQSDSNIFTSLEAGRGNFLPYVLAPTSLYCELGGLIRK